jgi:FdhD protein
LYASSSCGVCGKATIESALTRGGKVESELSFGSETIASFARKLRSAQPGFDRTGGLHAAALFDRNGEMLVTREDVGRHNAVDKVVGAALAEARRGADLALFVSGRVGFEIVQKAAAFGIPIVAGVSAPSSLAVRFGSELGVTVVGFVRGDTMNVYSHPRRVTVG